MLRSETAASEARRAAAVAGLGAYQRAVRPPPMPPAPEVDRIGSTRLLDHGGAGPAVLFVPSLINPSRILDLTPDRSLMRWLAGQGVRPLLVDWGEPDAPDLSLGRLVEERLLPFLRRLDMPVSLAGYCLGGTLALAAAALHPVERLALIAAPWRFAGLGAEARARIARLWRDGRGAAKVLGVVPMELLQSGFWALDAAATIRKYEAFAAMPADAVERTTFIAIEDWANDGAPLPYAAGVELFETLVTGDATGAGRWHVAGTRIDPARLTVPTIEFVAARDRIVPAATATGCAPPVRLDGGHVGMVVGSRRMALWEPLAAWLKDGHNPVDRTDTGEMP